LLHPQKKPSLTGMVTRAWVKLQDAGGRRSVVARPEEQPADESDESGKDGGGEKRASPGLRLQGLDGAHFDVPELEQTGESARPGFCTRPGNRFAVEANVDRQPCDAQGLIGTFQAALAVARGQRPVRQETAAGPEGRQVDDNAVTVSTNFNVLAVDGEMEIGKNFKR
jgi:hypothetical protein